MTPIAALQPRLANALAMEVSVHPVDDITARVEVPFYFPDGDGFVVYVRMIGDDRVEISDHAHTLMHVGYHTDIDRFYEGTRAELLAGILRRHRVEDRDGEFASEYPLDEIAQGLFAFVQALIEVSDMRMLDREKVRSTFKEDLRDLLLDAFGDELIVDFVDSDHDPRGQFRIPYVLNHTPRPIAVFDITTDESAAVAFGIAAEHIRWNKHLHLVAIERDQEELSKQRIAWISRLFTKQFPALSGNEDAIVDYLRDQHDMFKQLSQN